MKLKVLVFFGLLVTSLLGPATASSLAQTPTQTPAQAQQKEEPKVDPRSPYRVVIFDVKHRDANAVASALVGSGAPGTQIIPNRQLKTITVRDYAENISVIGEAIKRFDLPEIARPDPLPASFEIQLHLIAGSTTPIEKPGIPVNLEKVVAQLKATLKYGSYRYLTTLASRVTDGGSIDGNGFMNAPFPVTGSNFKSNYSYHLGRVYLRNYDGGQEVYVISQFKFNIRVPIENTGGATNLQEVGMSTTLTLREGETAVVGTANVGGSDEAIIVVVSVKKVK